MTTTTATREWEWKPLPNTVITIRHEPGLSPGFQIHTLGERKIIRDEEGDPLERIDRVIAQLTEARQVLEEQRAVHAAREAAG